MTFVETIHTLITIKAHTWIQEILRFLELAARTEICYHRLENNVI